MHRFLTLLFITPLALSTDTRGHGGLSPGFSISTKEADSAANFQKRWSTDAWGFEATCSPSVHQLDWESSAGYAFGADALALKDPAKVPYKEAAPEFRAVSVRTLHKILTFFEVLFQAHKKRTGNDWMFGGCDNMKSCSNDNFKRCFSNDHCDGGQCNAQLKFKMDNINMNIVDSQLVTPLTYYTKASLSSHLGGAKPNFFVSHNWGGGYRKFVHSVRNHHKSKGFSLEEGFDTQFYWVCTFANNQHKVKAGGAARDEELGTTPRDSSFGGAIKEAKGVVSVQDDGDADLTFTGYRVWCVYEYLVALELNKEWTWACISGAVFSSKDQGYSKELPQANKCRPELANILMTWDWNKLGYSQKQDVDNIRKEVDALDLPKRSCKGIVCIKDGLKKDGEAMKTAAPGVTASPKTISPAEMARIKALMMYDPEYARK